MTITSNLTGQVALITGGASGIGAGVAKSFLKCGARVIVNFLHEQERAKVICLIKETDGIGEAFRADVSEEEEVNKMINHVIKSYGRLDILVNNAGIVHSAPVESIQTNHWLETFNVHVNGTFFLHKSLLALYV